jgi:nitrite reductase (cytochrome c-552)
MREHYARLVAAGTGLLILGGIGLFALMRIWTADASEEDVDPRRWADRYPHHYRMTMQTQVDYGKTAYGGSRQYDKLKANPFRRRAFAGHAFELDYKSARGHFYSQIDQRESLRTREVLQPAACIQCHAAEGPRLIAEYGWEEFHRFSYDDLKHKLHHGTSCTDCHAPDTLELRIARPAFIRGMQQRGIDVTQATRQELRTYVCAQCHIEYYFRGENRELVPPWSHGLSVDEIEQHYDEQGFRDWVHAETGAPLIKIQHPDFELYSKGTHAQQGVSCADCHMPTTHDNGPKLTDHWIRSPLTNVRSACLKCHAGSEEELRARAEAIQHRTTESLRVTERAISKLMDAIVAAKKRGATDEALREAREFHRRAQLRWDFIDAENSTGFHSPHEAARALLHAVDFARRGERSVSRTVSAE